MSEANDQLQKRIKELIPINELPANLQTRLLEKAKVLDVKKSRFLFKQGDKDDYSYYLLDGEVELHANKQLDSVIASNSDRAKYALAQLQPRQFSVKAKTEIRVLLIERNNLDQLMLLAQESTLNPTLTSASSEIEVDEVDGEDDDTDWMTMMLQSELFSRIPTANIHQLFALLEPIDFNAGDVVIKQGDPGEHYYIISEGRCSVSRKPSPQSKDVKLAELKVGDSFGEEALISESTRNATVTMITDGVLMQLAKDTFVELVKNPTLQSLKFDEAEALVNEGSAKWLDVRFPNEHKESSIEGSLNVPLNSLRLQMDKFDTSQIYILYCDTGGRSSTGTFLLAERGFDVTYLDGGLVNNPEAIGVQTVVPKAPEPEKKTAKVDTTPESKVSDNVDAEARVELLNAELETTQIRMAKAKESKGDADAIKKEEHEANQKKLEEERAKLEKQKIQAEAEAKKKAEQEEARLKKLEAESEKQMQQEKQKLEEIYNKNAKDMEKLQKAKEAAEEKIRKEREKLEQQAEAAKKQIEEAKRIKEEAEASKKQLEKVEASKRKLEQEAEKKRLEDEERERQLQAEAKAKIEEERKKLAEQYERNSKEFEELQKEKAATEAARAAAKEEAAKMIEEYKMSHDKTRAEEEAKLKAERQKLEEEAKAIQETMKQIQQAKMEAEKIKQDALKQASSLKEKQMDSTSSQAQRDKLEIEIKAAEEKAFEAEREIEDAAHREKLTESAQQVNEADLLKKKQQEEKLRAQIEGDLEAFEEEQEEEKTSITQVQMQADMMKRIKLKAAEAKKNADKANANLLDDISRQLGEN
jgi:CRP-like cAMP-binding protein